MILSKKKIKLTLDQRMDAVAEFFCGKSSGVLARKYQVSAGYIRQLAWLYRHHQRLTVK